MDLEGNSVMEGLFILINKASHPHISESSSFSLVR
jgi:hypothetical protein